MARCQSFLQQGQPDHQVLLYFPFADRNHQAGRDLLHHFDGMQGFENTVQFFLALDAYISLYQSLSPNNPFYRWTNNIYLLVSG
ncbi:MAG: hypothetical protein SH818_02705 [Saprospiraceae bacterium]|nr:hypothetical protein [Saprospiraceae bacterium]